MNSLPGGFFFSSAPAETAEFYFISRIQKLNESYYFEDGSGLAWSTWCSWRTASSEGLLGGLFRRPEGEQVVPEHLYDCETGTPIWNTPSDVLLY